MKTFCKQQQVRVGFPGPPVDLDSDRRPPALSPSADIENKNSFHIRIEQRCNSGWDTQVGIKVQKLISVEVLISRLFPDVL
ncbi:hypothetical protein CDAR_232691 [Caerostris darwini]|uniref:Uncharacterized protein n=1 Tax=Caerostris darwini TaxID=1538125 RepID=A0AAV4TI99_9ARAC|nr:hypothetical protein CDAR_232691 [Caerostris darwini]